MQITAMTFNILIKQEEGLCVAHCLELDVVATGDSFLEAQSEIIDLIKAQVSYAFCKDNLAYLYHPAPAEVWAEFYACKEMAQQELKVEPEEGSESLFVPPWIIANTCKTPHWCHV